MVDMVNQIWHPSAITLQVYTSRNDKVLKAKLTLSCIATLSKKSVKVETVPKVSTVADIYPIFRG